MDSLSNLYTGALSLLTGGSFIWLQAIVLITALYLKIKKPDFIDNIETLDQSIKHLIATIVIPPVSNILSLGSFKSSWAGIFFMGLKFILNIAVAVLIALAIYQLWTSIKYQKPQQNL